MALIVGAPVHERGWILQHWFDHLANQEDFPSQDITVVLNYGESDDDTLAVIEKEQSSDRWGDVVLLWDREQDHVARRFWTLDRYLTMVRLRNDLLSYVREAKPDMYLSCDTDMLLPPQTLSTLCTNMAFYDGIAPLTFMTQEGENFPNTMAMDASRQKAPAETCRQYAVFGTVLMNKRLYSQVDYSLHGMGEDLGWARLAWEKDIHLAICPHVRVKHVMTPDMLGRVDMRVGF